MPARGHVQACNLVHHPASWMGSGSDTSASPVSFQSYSPSSKLEGVPRPMLLAPERK